MMLENRTKADRRKERWYHLTLQHQNERRARSAQHFGAISSRGSSSREIAEQVLRAKTSSLRQPSETTQRRIASRGRRLQAGGLCAFGCPASNSGEGACRKIQSALSLNLQTY